MALPAFGLLLETWVTSPRICGCCRDPPISAPILHRGRILLHRASTDSQRSAKRPPSSAGSNCCVQFQTVLLVATRVHFFAAAAAQAFLLWPCVCLSVVSCCSRFTQTSQPNLVWSRAGYLGHCPLGLLLGIHTVPRLNFRFAGIPILCGETGSTRSRLRAHSRLPSHSRWGNGPDLTRPVCPWTGLRPSGCLSCSCLMPLLSRSCSATRGIPVHFHGGRLQRAASQSGEFVPGGTRPLAVVLWKPQRMRSLCLHAADRTSTQPSRGSTLALCAWLWHTRRPQAPGQGHAMKKSHIKYSKL